MGFNLQYLISVIVVVFDFDVVIVYLESCSWTLDE